MKTNEVKFEALVELSRAAEGLIPVIYSCQYKNLMLNKYRLYSTVQRPKQKNLSSCSKT
jgi:hypothetical protein